MRLNLAMQRFLERCRIDPMDPPQLDAALARLLQPGIVQVEGSWLLASQVQSSQPTQHQHFPDRTGYEAFINHLHIADILEAGAEESTARILSQAVAFARGLEALVAPHGPFEIVVAIDKESPSDCNVRFYRRRPGETWIADDLEGYKEEGILVLDTFDAGSGGGRAAPSA